MQRRRFGREFKIEAVRLIKDRGVSFAPDAFLRACELTREFGRANRQIPLAVSGARL